MATPSEVNALMAKGRYLTLDNAPSLGALLYRVPIGFDRDYQAVIDGLMLPLTEASSWVKYGAKSPDEMASIFREIYVDYLMSDLCQAIADCINGSEVTQSALTQFMREGGAVNPASILPPSEVTLIEDCNEDNLWGAILWALDYLASEVEAFLQRIQNAGSDLSRIAELLSSFRPAFAIRVNAVSAIVDKISEYGLSAFVGAWTESLKLEIACAIMCKARCKCVVGLADIGNALMAGYTAFDLLDDLTEFIVTYAVSDETFTRAMMAFTIGAMQTNTSNALGITPLTLRQIMLLSEPDNGHAICSCGACCEVPYAEYFVNGGYNACTSWNTVGASVVAFSGMPSAFYALRVSKLYGGNQQARLGVIFSFSEPKAIDSIAFTSWYSITNVSNDGTRKMGREIWANGVKVYDDSNYLQAFAIWDRDVISGLAIADVTTIEIVVKTSWFNSQTIQQRIGEVDIS